MSNRQEAKIYKRAGSEVYQMRYYDLRGRLCRRSSETTDPKKAQRKLDDIVKELASEVVQEDHFTITRGFNQYMELLMVKPSTRVRYTISLAHIIEFCDLNSITTFDQLRAAEIIQFIQWRKRKGNSNPQYRINKSVADATIRRDLIYLSGAWNWLLNNEGWEDHLPRNPVDKTRLKLVPPSISRIRYASDEEWSALLGATNNPTHRNILIIAYETWMREKEILSLTWNDVILSGTYPEIRISADRSKNAKPRSIPLSVAAVSVLTNTVRHINCEYVFWRLHSVSKPIRYASTSGWWRPLREQAGVKNFRFHDIRHTFASNWLNRGGDIMVLKEILGHSSVKMTEIYGHLSNKRLHSEMAKVNLVSA